MSESEDPVYEQAVHFFHLHRELHALNDSSSFDGDVQAIEMDFAQWISDPEHQKAYAEVSNLWSSMDVLESVSEQELIDKGIDLSTEKETLIKKLKMVGGLALVDLVLSFVFPPLSLLEPVLIASLLYLGFKYQRMERATQRSVIPKKN